MWLVCAATENELAVWDADLFPDCERIVSGVGIPATFAALLPKVVAGEYSLLVNVGIAGAYPGSDLNIGEIVIGRSETYGDLGLELPDPPGFQALTDTPFGAVYAEPLPLIYPDAFRAGPELATANGATVNTCTGTDATGERRGRMSDAGFETMEGAAVAQVGQLCGVPVCEIRAISNIAARRDMRPENIRLALRNLREYLEACARK